ncbi:trypsin-like serine protease, partial [Micromonospora sp. KC606]
MAVAAVAVGSMAAPAGPVAAATNLDRSVSSAARTTGVPASADRAVGASALSAAAGTNAIFGPDDRVLSTPTTAFPASATVLLTFTGGRCTGFMISERTVATAGHCLHTGGTGGTWRTNVVAYPGHDGTTAPYGSCAATTLFAPQSWIAGSGSSSSAYDYGAVRLNCSVGRRTGWYNLGYTTQPVTGSCTTSHGYPVDRSGQWASRDYVRAETASLLYVQHDATAGQDGSPIFYTPDPD